MRESIRCSRTRPRLQNGPGWVARVGLTVLTSLAPPSNTPRLGRPKPGKDGPDNYSTPRVVNPGEQDQTGLGAPCRTALNEYGRETAERDDPRRAETKRAG